MLCYVCTTYYVGPAAGGVSKKMWARARARWAALSPDTRESVHLVRQVVQFMGVIFAVDRHVMHVSMVRASHPHPHTPHHPPTHPHTLTHTPPLPPGGGAPAPYQPVKLWGLAPAVYRAAATHPASARLPSRAHFIFLPSPPRRSLSPRLTPADARPVHDAHAQRDG